MKIKVIKESQSFRDYQYRDAIENIDDAIYKIEDNVNPWMMDEIGFTTKPLYDAINKIKDLIKKDENLPEDKKKELLDRYFEESKRVVKESIDKDEINKIIQIADKIGIDTIKDLSKFISNEVKGNESILTAMRRYRKSLGRDFKVEEGVNKLRDIEFPDYNEAIEYANENGIPTDQIEYDEESDSWVIYLLVPDDELRIPSMSDFKGYGTRKSSVASKLGDYSGEGWIVATDFGNTIKYDTGIGRLPKSTVAQDAKVYFNYEDAYKSANAQGRKLGSSYPVKVLIENGKIVKVFDRGIL